MASVSLSVAAEVDEADVGDWIFDRYLSLWLVLAEVADLDCPPFRARFAAELAELREEGAVTDADLAGVRALLDGLRDIAAASEQPAATPEPQGAA